MLMSTAPEATPAAMPVTPHAVALGNGWSLWRWAGLRATGFPLRLILDLASPAAAAAADQLIDAQERADILRSTALEALWRARPHETAELKSARRRVERGKPVELPPDAPGATAARQHADAVRTVAHAEATLQSVLETETTALSHHIRRVAADPRFREALAWQNRHALSTGVDSLLRADVGGMDRKDRQHEALIVRYLQRYCTKNDTFSFFGPVGWARWSDEPSALIARPAQTPLAARTTYFETWGIETLAAQLADRYDIRRWVAPRRLPFVRVAAGAAWDPGRGRIPLTPFERAVLLRADGERLPADIARDLAATLAPAPDEGQVIAVLDRLLERGVIAWTLEIPSDAWPERALRRLLERIEDDVLRQEVLEPLDRLERQRALVQSSAGDAARLDTALRDLEETFVATTGAAATREAGRMYAARTLVYEDCRRNVDVVLGTDLLEGLRRPLGLLLTSARWFVSELAQRYRIAFDALFDRLVQQSGTPTVDGITFWHAAQPLLFGERTRPIEPLVAELQARWATIWGLPATRRRIDVDSESLAPAVEALFAAAPADWPSGCYHSPDILIAAPGPEAIRHGECTFVLGEFHALLNTLSTSLFLRQHPQPEDLHAAAEADRPQPVVVPVAPRNWPGLTARTDAALISTKDVRLESAGDAVASPREQALAIADLVVERHDGRLIVRTTDGSRAFEVVDFFGTTLATIVAPRFHLFGKAEHMPRLTLDRLVVARESWHMPGYELPFIGLRDAASRFLEVRRWARLAGLPRFLFVRSPLEVKPFYLDLESPRLVDAFVKTCERLVEHDSEGAVTITEMLPGPDQAWLPDAQGERYASELRLIVVDGHAAHAAEGAR